MIREAKREDDEKIMEIWLDSNLEAHAFVGEEYWRSVSGMVRERLPLAKRYVYEENGEI